MKRTMIDNSKKLDTYKEKMAYHMGWVDGMKNSQQLRDAVDELDYGHKRNLRRTKNGN